MRKERRGLSFVGWLVFVLVSLLFLYWGVKSVFPFLAVNKPIHGEILVVEGWLPDYALERVIEIFNSGGYRRIVTTGGPLTYGSYLVGYKTCPGVAAATLKKLGFDESLISVVPAPDVMKDNTYAAGLSIKKWMTNSGLSTKSLNICSLGPHARRTRLLFEKALGDNVDVGVFALESRDYDPRAWWRTSKGVRTVLDEVIAWVYARFLFWPKVAHS